MIIAVKYSRLRRHAFRRRARRGVLMVIALAILAVVAALSMSALRSVATAARASQRQAWQAQAAWLAEAGVERGVARLRTESDYHGEAWLLTAADLTGAGDDQGGGDKAGDVKAGGGEVRIESSPTEAPGRMMLLVTAVYPLDPQHRATVAKSILVDIP